MIGQGQLNKTKLLGELRSLLSGLYAYDWYMTSIHATTCVH